MRFDKEKFIDGFASTFVFVGPVALFLGLIF